MSGTRGERREGGGQIAPALRASKRLVVAADDAHQAEFLAGLLRQAGYVVDVAGTGSDTLVAARGEPGPDVVLLDLALPDLSGIEVTRRLRAHSDVPIIIVSARRHESDKIAGLDAGANDYVTKPFSPAELLARVRVQVREGDADRANGVSHGVFTIGALRLDAGVRRLTRDGKVIDVSAREFDILQLLAEAARHAVPRQKLFASFWGLDFYGDERALDVYIRAIRKKIEPDPGHPRYLHTVRRVGYLLSDGWPEGAPSARRHPGPRLGR